MLRCPISAGRWINDPANGDQVISVEPDMMHFYKWENLEDISFPRWGEVDLRCRRPTHHSGRPQLIRWKTSSPRLSRFDGNLSTVYVSFLDGTRCNVNAKEVFALVRCERVAAMIEQLIGIKDERLLFLNKELWVCSLNMAGDDPEHIFHMFIPDEWINTNSRLVFQLTLKGDLVFVIRDEIAAIKRGLAHRATLNSRRM
jgi:hypothetical protein